MWRSLHHTESSLKLTFGFFAATLATLARGGCSVIGESKGRGSPGRGGGGWSCPPNGDWGVIKKQMLRWSRPLPELGEGWSGCQLPGWLVGVCVGVSALMGTNGDGDAAELGPVLTRGPSGDSSPPPSPRLLQPLTSTQTARRLMAGESLWTWRGAGP